MERKTSSSRPDSRCSSLSARPLLLATSEIAVRIAAPERGSAGGSQLLRPLELQRYRVVVARSRRKLQRCVVRDDPPARDDDRAIADRIDLFEDVRRDDDDLVARHLVDQGADLEFLVGIQAVGGLIED